jgi:hypothetical protein
LQERARRFGQACRTTRARCPPSTALSRNFLSVTSGAQIRAAISSPHLATLAWADDSRQKENGHERTCCPSHTSSRGDRKRTANQVLAMDEDVHWLRATTTRRGALGASRIQQRPAPDVSGQIGLPHKASITARGASGHNLYQGVLQTMALHVAHHMSYRS